MHVQVQLIFLERARKLSGRSVRAGVGRNRGRLIKSVVVQMGYSYLWITVVIPELIHANQVPSEARSSNLACLATDAFIRPKCAS